MRCRRLVPAVALLAILVQAIGGPALIAGALPGPGVSPNPLPAMAVALSPTGVMAYPTESVIGVARISGTVMMDKVPGERIVVTVSGVVDIGWAVTVSPSQLVFYNNKIDTFEVTVVCWQGTPARSAGVLTIEAMGSGLGFAIQAMSQAMVIIAPYYRLFLDSPMGFKEITPARSLTFELEVLNWGNAEDSFDIWVGNMEELANKGWTVSFSTTTAARVGPGQSKYIKMFVQPAFSSTPYKAEGTSILVNGISQNGREAGNTEQKMYQFVVYERGTYIDVQVYFGLSLLIVILVPVAFVARYFILRRRARRQNLKETPKKE